MSTNSANFSVLGNLSAEDFLAHYWQKKPLLIRAAIPEYECPISAEELGGLALEEEVESRVILEKGATSPWELHRGPFSEGFLNALPKKNWTLLVQQLDAWVPEISELLKLFSFIPNWRIDDIMASYAPEGGSVGPHFDQYDVFLLQAEGQRRWKVGQRCDDVSPQVEGTDLCILQDFEVQDEWVLNPGDILYLPPGVAHWGIAENRCITLSIGFRAPSQLDLMSHFIDHMLDQKGPEVLLSDNDLTLQSEPGEISQASLSKATALLINAFQNRQAMAISFGEFTTEPKNETVIQAPEEAFSRDELREIFEQNESATIRQNEGSRFAYIELDSQVLLFVDGKSSSLPPAYLDWVKKLCRKEILDALLHQKHLQDPVITDLMLNLINQGSLYIEE